MEYFWIVFAFGAMIASGLGSFVKKLALCRGIDKDVFMFTSFCLYISFFSLNMLVQGDHNFHRDILIGGIILGILNSMIAFGALAAFKYLDISFALVSMRLIASFLILIIGVFIIGEELSLYNYIGFLIGAIAIFLLSGYKVGQTSELRWKGVVGVILVIAGNVGSHTGYKFLLPHVNVHDYMFIQYVVAFICILLYMVSRGLYNKINIVEVKKSLPFSCTNLILYSVMFLYFFPNLYTFGTLALGYKILSYSLVIPIFLSILFLGESVNRTRILAFGLTIISIFLFLV